MRTEKLIAAIAWFGATAAINVGCVAHGSAGAYAEVDTPVVFAEPPTLVLVDSDVWVVRDYDYPVYYYGDFYWVYRDNVWYRSHTYDGGWATVQVDVVPGSIAHRDHRAYVHYHGSADAQTRVAARAGGYTASEPTRQRGGEPPGREPARKEGPPDRAAAPQGGSPGHQEAPGVGNQRREETPNASSPNKKKNEVKKVNKKDTERR